METDAIHPLLKKLQKIPSELLGLDQSPQWGFPPAFPWEAFQEQIKSLLQGKETSISISSTEWKKKADILESKEMYTIPFAIPSVPGNIFSTIERKTLLSLFNKLTNQNFQKTDNLPKDFFSAFHHFLCLNALSAMKNSNYLIIPVMESEKPLQEEEILCMKICFLIDNAKHDLFLLFTPSFVQEVRTQTANQENLIYQDSPYLEKISLTLSMEIGSIAFSIEEWKTIQEGDLILLDSCSYDPYLKTGSLNFTIQDTCFFTAAIQENKVTIDQISPLQEVKNMTNHQDPNHNDEKVEPSPQKPEQTPDAPKEVLEQTRHSATKNIKDISLPITVELGRIQMDVKSLLDLQPGNLLNLNIPTNQEVDLVVHGKCIGKGELVQVGETVGVKIHSIGS